MFYENLKVDRLNCQSFTLSVEQNLSQEDNEYWLSLQRVKTFAETLFTAEKNFKNTNLSYFIKECRQCKSKSGTARSEFIQSKIAEVQAARLIALLDLPFKFVQPQGKHGDDYDLLVTLPDNTQIACEVKRKIDGQSLNIPGFSSTKKRAYKQLGSLPRKVVFIKVPGSWAEEQDFQNILYPDTIEIKFFTEVVFWEEMLNNPLNCVLMVYTKSHLLGYQPGDSLEDYYEKNPFSRYSIASCYKVEQNSKKFISINSLLEPLQNLL